MNINFGNYTSVGIIMAPCSNKKFLNTHVISVSVQMRLVDEHLKNISNVCNKFKYGEPW